MMFGTKEIDTTKNENKKQGSSFALSHACLRGRVVSGLGKTMWFVVLFVSFVGFQPLSVCGGA